MLPGAALPLFWAGLVGLGPVSVEGSASCPDPALVAERLRRLLPAGAGGEAPEIARIDSGSGGITVRLLADDGRLIGERTLPGEHRCDELADAAALMIATWVDDRATPGLQTPAGGEPPTNLRARLEPAPGRGWDVGASLGGSLSAAGVAPAAQVGGGAGLAGRLGLRLEALFTGWAETPLGEQAARWRRTSLSLAGRTRAAWSWLTAELQAGPAVAWLQVEGRGFAAMDTRRQGDLVFGMSGGARLALSRPGLQPFVQGALAFWPSRSLVYSLPQQTTAPLPRAQLALTLGVSYQR